jgi:hypothetical protein
LNKKKIKILLCAFQALLVGMLFAPAGNGNVNSLFAVIHLYNGQGYGLDVRVFLFMALGIPLAIVLSLFLMKERSNYGFGACIAAMLTFAYAVFYEAVKNGGSIPLSFSVRVRFYLLILLALLSVLAECVAFIATPPREENKKA